MKKSEKEPAKISVAPNQTPWDNFLDQLRFKLVALISKQTNNQLVLQSEEKIEEANKKTADSIVQSVVDYADSKWQLREDPALGTQVARKRTLIQYAMNAAIRQPLTEELPNSWSTLFEDVLKKVDREAGR